MGVLNPIELYAEELEELNQEYSEMIEWTIENLNAYASAIINDRHELIEEEDPFFFLIWRNDDVMEIDSVEEIQDEIETLKMYKQDITLGAVEGRYAKTFAERLDVEPDYENPLPSYRELDDLKQKVDGFSERIDRKIVEKFDLDPERLKESYDIIDYKLFEVFYTLSDKITAIPMMEARVEAEQNIEREKENLLSKAVDEHRKHKESISPDYNRPEMPLEPVRWDKIIGEENLQDYIDISEMPGVTYGDTLHIMMEDLAEEVDSVQPEYPLHFRNKGERDALSKENRIDDTLRPDAVGDLFVYEFKHMPRGQSKFLDQNGELERDGKFEENVRQLNLYLNELDLPAGMLVYVSSEMEVKEYVVERHDINDWENYLEEFDDRHVHDREEYDFENLFE